MYFCGQMNVNSLQELKWELYTIFQNFLLEHKWSREERETDRMRNLKRKNLRLTADLLRIMMSTFYMIKTKGNKKDFHVLMKRLYVFSLKIYEQPNEKLREMIEDEINRKHVSWPISLLASCLSLLNHLILIHQLFNKFTIFYYEKRNQEKRFEKEWT